MCYANHPRAQTIGGGGSEALTAGHNLHSLFFGLLGRGGGRPPLPPLYCSSDDKKKERKQPLSGGGSLGVGGAT